MVAMITLLVSTALKGLNPIFNLMSPIAKMPLNTVITLQEVVMLIALGVVVVQSDGDALALLIPLFALMVLTEQSAIAYHYPGLSSHHLHPTLKQTTLQRRPYNWPALNGDK